MTKARSIRPIKICHLADVHLGYRRFSRLTKQGFNQREVDVSASFRECVDRLIGLKPDLVIIAGDLFHSVRPSNAILLFAFREIKRLIAHTKAPCVIVAGNHEFPRRSDSGSPLRILSELPGVFLAEAAVERFQFPDLSLALTCLPHAALAELNREDLRADERFARNVLVCHAQLEQGWTSDFGGVELGLNDLNIHEWDYVALGHVHLRSDLGLNASYSGSLENTSYNFWSEANRNKGFLEVDLPDLKRTFHALSSPRQVLVLDSIDAHDLQPAELDAKLAAAVEAAPGGIAAKLVRLEVRRVSREVQRQLDYRQIRKWKAEALHFGLELRAPEHIQSMPSMRANSSLRMESELLRFCQEWKFSQVKSEEVAELLRSYLRQLEESDEAA